MTDVWQPGTIYAPGATVIPATVIPPTPPSPIGNPGFESGDSGWTKGTGWTIENDASKAYQGTWTAKYDPIGTATIINNIKVPVIPGQIITAKCYVRQGNAGAGDAIAAVLVRWYTSGNVFISDSVGTYVTSSSGSTWKLSSGTATAPATAAFASIGATSTKSVAADLWVDSFSWDYAFSGQADTSGFVYRATQAAAALSGGTEPVWPTTLAGTVVDGGVTWTAGYANRVVWKAHKLLESGATEPTWPTEPGALVADNTVSWKTVVFHIEDEKCPNTKVAHIIASKVFCAGVDGDIVNYCATLNARDWTSVKDAGFIPSGLNQTGQIGVTALGRYRGNLCIFNGSHMQMWQVDPDPELMALLDAKDGVGCLYPESVHAVNDELFFLSNAGVRTVGLAAGSNNLSAGDVGMPVDEVIQDAMASAIATDQSPLSTYFPAMGQYMLTFSDYPRGALSITGDLPDGDDGDVVAFCYVTAGGLPAYSYALSSGSLPTGVTLNTSTGCLSGTVSDSGTFTWCVTVTDENGDTSTICNTVYFAGVVVTVSGDIPDGYTGDVISVQYSATGGTGPYTFSISAGALPSGVTMNSAGLATGVFTTAESASWTVEAEDSLTHTGTHADTAEIAEAELFATFSSTNLAKTLDQFDGAFISSYGTQVSPGYVAACPSQHKVYVGSITAATGSGMSVYDVQGETYSSVISGTASIAFTGGSVASLDGTRVAAHDYSNNLVYVFNATTDTLIGTISITNPVGVVFSADSTLLYVCAANSGQLKEYNATTLSFTGRGLSFAADGRSMDITRDGEFLFFARQSSATITRVRLSSFATSAVTVGSAASDNHQINCSLDSVYCYVCNQADSDVDVIDTATNTIVDSISVSGAPYGLLESPDGAYIYIFSSSPDKITKIDQSDFSTVSSLTLAASCGTFVMNPYGDAIYASLSNQDIVKVDTNTMTVDWTKDNTGGAGACYGLAFKL